MAKNAYIRLNGIYDRMDRLYETGLTKGLYCGFETIYPFYSPKLGGMTFIFGHPFSGKTEIILDMCIAMSKNEGLKHVLYTPETGTPEEIGLELISKAAGKPVYANEYHPKMPLEDYYYWRDWVAEHFYVVDPEEDAYTLKEFYQTVDLVEHENECKITITVCDPFNELKHEMVDSRQDLYLEEQFGEVRRNAKKHHRHNILITHTSRQDTVNGKGENGEDIQYYPIPTPHQVSGGLAWHRKAMNLIAVWRPPKGLVLNGQTFEENEVHFIVHKFKPKGTGKKGVVKLFFDVKENRYYEWINGGERRNAGPKEKQNAGRISRTDSIPF